MIKANIDTAREEQRLLRKANKDRMSADPWSDLIQQWKQELKDLPGEDY